MNFKFGNKPSLRKDYAIYDAINKELFSDKLNIIMLQIPCLEAESISDCSEEYEFLLYLLNHMHKNMKTIEQLKKEVEQTNLPDDKKELFYKVLDTADVESLSEKERFQYEAELKYYRDTMNEYMWQRETLEDYVVYQAMYGEHGIWVRPKAMFEETIIRDGQTFRRFSPISEEEALRCIALLKQN